VHRRSFLAAGGALLLAGCSRAVPTPAAAPTTSALSTSTAPTSSAAPSPTPTPAPTRGTPAEIAARSTVPVLCYHQLRELEPDDGEYSRSITFPPAVFRAQMQALRDGGRTPIRAAALLDHLEFGTPLPERPVLLTFDDGSAGHATVALPVLQEMSFPAIFFPMTVVLDKPDWLSRDDLRRLEAAGMEIGGHTWDHQRLDRLPDDQWTTQLEDSAATLAEVLGHPVDVLAYPFGAWAPRTLPHVTEAGFRAAFQLSDPIDPAQPMLTIRRVMPSPTWDAATLLAHLDEDFGPGA